MLKLLSVTCVTLLLCAGLSCDKHVVEPPSSLELPTYTETGANTCAWIVNESELIIARDNWPIDAGVKGSHNPETGYFEIQGHRVESKQWSKDIYIYGSKVLGKGKYRLGNDDDYAHYYIDMFSSDGMDKSYYTDSIYTGEVEITMLDTAKRIISGKFHCKLAGKVNTPPQETVTIRGQFDFIYPKYN